MRRLFLPGWLVWTLVSGCQAGRVEPSDGSVDAVDAALDAGDGAEADDGGVEPADDGDVEPADDGAVEPEDDGYVEPADDGYVEPADDGAVEPEDDGYVEPADAGPDLGCPPAGGQDCSPGPGTGEGDQCFDAASCFYPRVRDAVNGVVAGNPDWFDLTGNPLVLQDHIEDYMDAVVASLNGGAQCAQRDPNAGDEISVKYNNAYSENFDILTWDNYVRSGAGIFTGTCAPAWW